MSTFKPVGVDENGKFPTRVQTALNATYAPATINGKQPVRKGDIVVSVSDYYPNGYAPGVTDVKSALDAAVTAAPEGATVQFEPGANYFLTYGEPITKALTLDLNGATFTVDPTPGSGTSGKPVFYFVGALAATSHNLAAVAENAVAATLSTSGDAANYSAGDYVIISDSTQVLPWDSAIPGATSLYPAGYTGREEINSIQSIDAGTGVITLNKPTKWAYATTPKIQKITKALKNAKVINGRKITEVDPGGLNGSSLFGANAPHLVHFQYAENPVVQNMHFDSWNVHAVNFHRCINPAFRNSSGRNPFRPTDGGHGYLSRLDRCIGGTVSETFSYKVRHHVDHVMNYDATSAHNLAVAPVSCAYMGHGLGAKNIVSDNDAVEDAGAAWGWGWGNLAFGPDYNFTIISPRYSGTGTPIVFHATAQGLRVLTPDVSTTARCVTMTTGATGLEIRGGTLRTIGASASANTVLVRDKAAAADAYGLRPGSLRLDGVRLAGANPSMLIDAAGSVDLTNLIADEADAATVGGTLNLIQFTTSPAALRVSGNRFAGNYTNAVYYTTAAPTGAYVMELNDVRGYTGRAITLPAAANLRFIGNTASNNGGGLNPWNFSGDLNAAKAGSADYAAVVIGNSPRTLDEARVLGTTIAGAAGTARSVSFNTGDTLRWIMRATSAAETGSDAGTDFELVARTDAGAAGPQIFLAKRTGDSSWGASGKKLGFYGATGSTKPSVTGSRAGEPATTTSLRAALVALGLITDNTTA